MGEILIFQFAPHEGPGHLADYLRGREVRHRLVRIDRNQPLPSGLESISGLVFMGGSMSVNDPLPWLAPLMDLIRRGRDADLPMLGHCLGGQLISKALGGVVSRNPVKEIGWLPVERVDKGAADQWLAGLPGEFEVFHWHGEVFSIPAGATRILASGACANQAFVIGNTLALQCHVEMTAAMVRDWAALEPQAIATATSSIQTREQMSERLDERVRILQHHADLIYSRWLQPLVCK